jgi:tRNA nucleotidyltransferase (CCA-adding enzyme)
MKFYLVGGYVRDVLLAGKEKNVALSPVDKDYVVIGGNVEEMLSQGFAQVGAAFPVFIHPVTDEEYALARTERKTGKRHTDFAFDFSADISLEEDAQRRDFSINALYYDPESEELLDPTGRGIEDYHAKILRHAGPGRHFAEDPLRVLRCARFAAQLSFSPDPDTERLIEEMVQGGMLRNLSRERIDNELKRAFFAGYDSSRFLFYLQKWGALAQLYPELERLVTCVENPRYHLAKTSWGHILAALDVAQDKGPRIKTSIIYHDIYKPIAYAKKLELKKRVPHDDSNALKYLEGYLAQRTFDSQTKRLCRLAVHHHMRMRCLFEGMSIKKWVDMIGAITWGFREDHRQELTDLLEVCKADDISDKRAGCFHGSTGKDRWKVMHNCALQTFEVCNKIQARTLPHYQEMNVEKLKLELREARIKAVSEQVDFFRHKKEQAPNS